MPPLVELSHMGLKSGCSHLTVLGGLEQAVQRSAADCLLDRFDSFGWQSIL